MRARSTSARSALFVTACALLSAPSFARAQTAPTQPTETQPAAAQPAATQPAATQPAATQPAATQPVATQPAAARPAPWPAARTSPPPVLRFTLGVGPSLVWRVSDGYELFHSARVATAIDAIGSIDVLRVHDRWEFSFSAGYRYDAMSRRYGQTIGTSLTTHDASVGVTARWAVHPLLAPFVRAEALLSTHVTQIAPDQGAGLSGVAFAPGALASLGLTLRSGAVLPADSPMNLGLFLSVEAGARLVTDAPIEVRPQPSSDPRIAAEALPVTSVTVARLNGSTPFLRAIAGIRF